MPTSVPKEVLIRTIVREFSEEEIVAHFRISPFTSVDRRLRDFSKGQLEGYLRSTETGLQRLSELEFLYPLDSPKAFYLPRIQSLPDTNTLLLNVERLAELGRDGGLLFGSESAVRVVYARENGQKLERMRGTGSESHNLLEIPLYYERRIEYGVSDPADKNYGERAFLYSLEIAYFWVIDDYPYGVVCCSGLPAAKSILNYLTAKLSTELWLPNMTSSMYNRLVEGGTPSSTTHVSGDSGVTTTLSSRQLTQSPEYQTITSDPQQLSKAGYFRDHPLLLKGGFGFSKQHSRAWTPRQLSKRELITAIVEIIQRTNQELEVEFGQDLAGYISFFENAPVNIDGKQLKGTARQAFDHLVAAILGAMQRPDKEIHIPPAQLQELFKFRKELKLLVSSVFECTNCGNVLGRCPECMLPYEIDNKNGLRLRCPRCNRSLKEDDQFECECSTMNDIGPLEGHVQLYPQPELLDALKAYFALMEEISWNQLFFVHGYLLRVLDKPRPKFAGIYSLGDLASWEVGARLKSRSPTRSNISILSATKEKCKVNNYHPNRGDCERCRARTISPHLIKMPGELCLPRIMGLPIGQKFDGIHHGYEKADVIYEDTLNGTSVQIGIHLKSRTKSKPNGLGRSMDLIKALYTQLFYSAYLALSGKIELDMIGISVPNTISSEVVESMGMLVQQLGFAFLVVDEDAWLKITDAALEQAAFVQSIQ